MGSPALIVRLRPTGPWRPGSATGNRDEVDRILHSDTLYSAMSCAFGDLGLLPEWLEATARAEMPAVRLSSAFPFAGRTLLVPAPRNAWPPDSSGKIRWKAASFIPASLIGTILSCELPSEERWVVDPTSQCLLPIEKNGVVTEPFRIARRTSAAVDRLTQSHAHGHPTACLEFNAGAGLWCVAVFADNSALEGWGDRIRAAFRLLADSGLGGERSSGWGCFEQPEFEPVEFPEFIIIPKGSDQPTGYWLWSLFQPGTADSPDWTAGAYTLTTRSGRVARHGQLKPASRMVEEGSVLASEQALIGAAKDVAPEGAEFPVYRAGFAVALPIPL